jgi:hypothetical protein
MEQKSESYQGGDGTQTAQEIVCDEANERTGPEYI